MARKKSFDVTDDIRCGRDHDAGVYDAERKGYPAQPF